VLDGAVIVCRDVTDRKRLERQLLQAQKLEAIGQLAAGIAHEINTPTQYVADNMRFASQALVEVISVVASHRRVREKLRAMMPDAEAVLEADAVEKRADIEFIEAELPLALEQSLEGIERIAEIVRGMKAFSQPGAGAPAPTDLNEELESALAVGRNEWRYAAEIVRDLDLSLPPVYCRVGEISQVFLGVILNAAHAIAESHGASERGMGEIRVSTRRDGDFVEIRIADTGGGIPDEVRPRIFDPFFTTRTVGSGTGQGLAIAHAVIEKHGGTISFDTEVGVGTTFIIRLPLIGMHGMAAVGASV
jgi:signal transduction histidine kinase